MKYARTVLGDIEADKMGFTYPHEHLYAVPPASQKDRDLEVSDDYTEKRMALRSLMNIRMPGKMAEDVVRVQDEFLSEEAEENCRFSKRLAERPL